MLVVFQGVSGIVVLVAFSHLVRKQYTQPQWRMLLISLAFQIGITALFLKYPFFKDLLGLLNGVVTVVDTATRADTSMVFGFLGGSPEPFAFAVPQPANSFVLAFRALSIVLMFSVLWALL